MAVPLLSVNVIQQITESLRLRDTIFLAFLLPAIEVNLPAKLQIFVFLIIRNSEINNLIYIKLHFAALY
ncbi:hypothetical protein yaldo0001_18360 [Yersinia aldovae ATCC 35236]|nr:hypothetical protein yaldo0001_18360 [Yersinia aldovae ATCC 35236]